MEKFVCPHGTNARKWWDCPDCTGDEKAKPICKHGCKSDWNCLGCRLDRGEEVFFESYDLLVKLADYNAQVGDGWNWRGVPMRELDPINKRLKREKKSYGSRLLAYRITLTRVNVRSGDVQFTTVEEFTF